MAPLVIVTLLVVYSGKIVKAQAPPPVQFVFGDTLIDPGNNNYILTIAKSNFPPNGIDFQGGQGTGRFCNGRTAADIVDNLILHFGDSNRRASAKPRQQQQHFLVDTLSQQEERLTVWTALIRNRACCSSPTVCQLSYNLP